MIFCLIFAIASQLGSDGRAARQSSAKARTAVRIRFRPQKNSETLFWSFFVLGLFFKID